MAVATDPACTFSYCLCRWLRHCSPAIPPIVGSGGEFFSYIPPPDDAVDSPTLSVLVGVESKFDIDSSLRLHRFRVERSGRVLGRSGEALEIFADGVDYKRKSTWSRIRAAAATRSTDGGSLSLCCFYRELDLLDLDKFEPARAVELHVDLDLAAGAADNTRVTVSPLPGPTLCPLMPTYPVSAAGELWAPYLTETDGPSRLVMQRLDKDASGRWVEVADLHLPHGRKGADDTSKNPVFQGFAVAGHIILLSLYPANLFFTFDCSTLTWASVITDETRPSGYVPIHKRAVYVEEDDTIYFLSAGTVFAYKLCQVNRHQHRMEPPIRIGCVCPFRNEGNGFLAHLGGRVLCLVWIGEKLDCKCDTKHVLITTFRVLGDDCGKNIPQGFVPNGIVVLHSTRRRFSMWPSKTAKGSFFEFSFLQVYEEFRQEAGTASAIEKIQKLISEPGQVVASSSVSKSSKMLPCCRNFFIGPPFSDSVMLERSAIHTRKALYVVCQVASSAAVFGINIIDGKLTCHDKTLTFCTMGHPPGCHYVSSHNSIFAVSSKGRHVYELSLDTMDSNVIHMRPIGDVRLVCKVGNNIVAISDSFQTLYLMTHQAEWVCCETSGIPDDPKKEVNLSGYVVLSDCAFMVSDAKSNLCFLFDMRDQIWIIVEPYALQDRTKQLPSFWPGSSFLRERSVFVEGFIYTCSSGGLTAYELIEEGGSFYLGDGIDLEFSWRKSWEHNRMCLDCVEVDTSSGAIMFCVVQDDFYQPGFPITDHPVCFTTVQVKTEGMHIGKLKPKAIGHVDIARSYIVSPTKFDSSVECDAPVIWTRSCISSLTVSHALQLL